MTFTKALISAVAGLLIGGGAVAQEARPQYAMSDSYVPVSRATASAATVELRSEATIIGREVKLKSVARWSAADAAAFARVGDLTVATIDPANPFRAVTVEQLRTALAGAGMNLAAVRFTGPLSCTITRSDTEMPAAGTSLEQWSAARAAAPVAASQPVAPTTQLASEPVRPLRDLLVADLAERLQLPAESLQVQFDAEDEKTIMLTEPAFRFQITPQRAKNLGVVRWDVVVTPDAGGAYRKVTVDGVARAWRDELVATRPLAYRQLVTDADVTEQRVLLERLPEDSLLTRQQVVGQQTARAIVPGAAFTARSVEAIPLVKMGQLVTVTLHRGGLQLTTVARALEPGSMGQAIKLRNESTKDNFDATVTGPQTARME